MTNLFLVPNRRALALKPGRLLCLLPLSAALCAASASESMPVIPKWGRFEQSFKSTVSYSNALQQASLTVVFTSPLGDTSRVAGFWDGGNTWRVRISPDQPGHWTFESSCSDAANKGLNHQTGQFICTAATGQNQFDRHGPVRIARDHLHFEHADGSPFFWLADTAWNGARISETKDWNYYAGARAAQKFSAVQWCVAPGEDLEKQSAFTGKNLISVNPDFFKRLDAKVDTLNNAGLLSVIAPLWEINQQTADPLPADQAALLLQYMTARWGANDVAWLLSFEGGGITRWKHIGQAVFGDIPHAPVILFPGEAYWALDEFRIEPWVDVFGYQSGQNLDDDSLKWMLSGPLSVEWTKEPPRPLINIAPPRENGIAAQSARRITADDVRHATWWSLLLATPAGVSYSADGVSDWNTTVEQKKRGPSARDLPVWKESLFLPGAKQLSHATDLFTSIDFWRLRPAPQSLPSQPAIASPRRHIAAAATGTKDLSVIYVPEDHAFEMFLDALPSSPAISWTSPRTGQTSTAVAVIAGRTCQFPTPGDGDWVLVIKAGK
jgi:hypothetical protein